MGAPGWPELACSTASIASVRIVLMLSVSSCCAVAKTCSLATMRIPSSTGRLLYRREWPIAIRVTDYRKGSGCRKVYPFPGGRGLRYGEKLAGRIGELLY